MNNGAISKVKAKILDSSKQINILDTKNTPNQLEIICGKQATQNKVENSNILENKFDLPSFKCEMCPYESIWKHAVKRHQQTHNITVGKAGSKKSKYKCETCSYTTNNWTILKDHQKLHASPNRNVEINEHEDLFMKEIKESKNYQELELHKTPVYTRKTGKYQTNHRVTLESNKKVHLPSKGDEVFRCDFCSFNSVYRQSLLRHMKTMHENEKKAEGNLHSNYSGITSVCKDQFEEYVNMDKGNMKEIFDDNGKKIRYSDSPSQTHKYLKKVTSKEIISSTPYTDPTLKTTQIQKGISRTRRGKYSDVPVKTTKNGLFECEHCSYQTAIRTALVKHQKNHLKNANS